MLLRSDRAVRRVLDFQRDENLKHSLWKRCISPWALITKLDIAFTGSNGFGKFNYVRRRGPDDQMFG